VARWKEKEGKKKEGRQTPKNRNVADQSTSQSVLLEGGGEGRKEKRHLKKTAEVHMCCLGDRKKKQSKSIKREGLNPQTRRSQKENNGQQRKKEASRLIFDVEKGKEGS